MWLKKSLQKAHWVSEINRAEDAGRVPVPWKNLLLAHPCLLRMQAFGLQLIKGLPLKYTLFQQKCQCNLFCLWKICKASPARFPSSDTSNPLWNPSDSGLDWQVQWFQNQTCTWILQTSEQVKHVHCVRQEHKFISEVLSSMRRGPQGPWGSESFGTTLIQQCLCTYPTH